MQKVRAMANLIHIRYTGKAREVYATYIYSSLPVCVIESINMKFIKKKYLDSDGAKFSFLCSNE